LRPTFYCHLETGLWAWTPEQASENPQPLPSSLAATGPEWDLVRKDSSITRNFSNVDEWEHKPTKLRFYVRTKESILEQTARKLQQLLRLKCGIKLPWSWAPVHHQFSFPPDALDEARELASWAYLRRRSILLGEFIDISGQEWEEYSDKISAEFFYWNEESNSYRFMKPEVDKYEEEKVRTDGPPLNLGDIVMYKFKGEFQEARATVIRDRVDDQTGADMYDVERIIEEYELQAARQRGDEDPEPVIQKWVGRGMLKLAIKAGDELKLARMENEWRQNIRRQRAMAARNKAVERRQNIVNQLAEMAMLAEEDDTMGMPEGKESAANRLRDQKNPLEMLIRKRQIRADTELRNIEEVKDKADAEKRAVGVAKLIEAEKEKKGGVLTRSEMIALQRSMDMKLMIEDRIRFRNEVQEKLKRRQERAAQREQYIEDYLRNFEMNMATPRTSRRRTIIRNVHRAMSRQKHCYLLCEWGCGEWVLIGQDQMDHQKNKCTKRILPCQLYCGVKMSEEEWLKPQVRTQNQPTCQYHSISLNITQYHSISLNIT
jgi:hypothetical protein